MDGSFSGDSKVQISAHTSRKRGGWITLPFMIVTLLGLTVTAWGWFLNLIVFLIEEFNVKSIAAAQISNIIIGCVCIFPVVGAIIADSFVGTIQVISASALINLIGIGLLTLIVSLDSLRPQPCKTTSSLCESPSKLQLGTLYTAMTLASIGIGGTRYTLATAGANQYDKPKDQGSFFNWFFFTFFLGSAISATALVYAEDNISWKFGFGLCTAANLLSLVFFLSGKRFYRHDEPLGSPFTSLLRVVVASILKRKAVISSKEEDYYQEIDAKAETYNPAMPTKSFRFFNRAALKTEDDIKPDGSISNLWRLSTVQQVEDFKAVIRVLPLWLATIFYSTPIATQYSMMVLQALVMDRRLGPHFNVPAGSLQAITFISACIFLILNDWLLFPLYKKLTGRFLTPLQRVGIGHVFNILSMSVSAVVEAKRLKIVENDHLLESTSVAPMSVSWLFLPLAVVGIGEAFQFPGNISLYYQEFPKSLKSTATAMASFIIGICFYVSTGLIILLQRTTVWLPDDINRGRVDNVYWVLAVLGVLNLSYFLVCAWLFQYRNLRDDGTSFLVVLREGDVTADD